MVLHCWFLLGMFTGASVTSPRQFFVVVVTGTLETFCL